MSTFGVKRVLLGTTCALALALGAGAPGAQGAATDPLFVFTPAPPSSSPSLLPPSGSLYGPCGLAVDSNGRFYVSDYPHHAVDVFTAGASQASPPSYVTQLAGEDPFDGPCGSALDSSNDLYVNNFHRNVVKFNPSPSFGAGTLLTGAGADATRPTGVAVDASNNLYVNDRTYIAEYNLLGVPIQQIGLGNLGEGYGVAVSQFPGTLGYVYIPDASTNTVKVYDPATSLTTPKAEIKDPFNKPFVSLRDSAIAIDKVSGDVYVVDNTQPKYTEKPQATIYIYGSAGSYKGHLKYNIVDALPPGLAVDNNTTGVDAANQGRVYVTSGNTSPASIYVYPPGAGTFAAPLPPTTSLAMRTSGSGEGAVTSSAPMSVDTGGAPAPIDCASACEAPARLHGPHPRRHPKHRHHRKHRRARHHAHHASH